MKTSASQKITHQQRSTLVIGMGSCYALGNFTDNFFKQCAVLLAASAAMPSIQSLATILYSLPFILCSAWAGWLADRMVKKNIVLAAKVTELLSLVFGAYALATGWWLGILFVVFFMGLQSTFFSPALNGSIPESFPTTKVPQVNSYIKLASTIAVLAGIACAGFFLDLRPNSLLPNFGITDDITYGRIVSGAFVAFISLLGVLAALTLKSTPQACKDQKKDFPWSGPVASLHNFWQYRKDPQFFIVLIAEGFFYGVAAIAVICIANLANELGYSATLASLLSACIMVGIAVGAIFAGRFDAYSWRWLLVPAALGMGSFMLFVFCTPYIPATSFSIIPNLQLLWFFGALFGAGICGGIYLIPLASFIQVHPKPGETGKALGVSNFFSFVAIAIAGIIFYPISMLPAAWTFFTYGLSIIAFALLFVAPGIRKHCGLLRSNANTPLSSFLKYFLTLRYRITEKGLNEITLSLKEKKQPLLFLPNHPALIDPIIVFSRIAGFKPRALVDEHQMSGIKKHIARWLNMILIPDMEKDGRKGIEKVKRGLQAIEASLKNGDSVLLYPSGRLYRSQKESLGANSAVHHILQAVPETRVILVRTTGLWGSSFSYANGNKPNFMSNLVHKIFYLFGNLFLFMPKRKVTIEFTELPNFSPLPNKTSLNKSFEEYYNATEQPAVTVPYFFWQGNIPLTLQ